MSTDGDHRNPADDDDTALEGERYQGVRDLFRQAREDGFDEEPSPRIDALLMAAARARAEKKVGAFERLRRWLVSTMMQPAVAGAVMVAVIGGTAGVLYMKGKGGVVEPHVSSPPSPPPAVERPGAQADTNVTVELPKLETTTESAVDVDELQAKLRQPDDLRQGERETMTSEHTRSKGDGSKTIGDSGGGGDQVSGSFESNDDRGADFKADGRGSPVVIATDEAHRGGQVPIGGVTTHMGTTGTTTESPPPPPDGSGATVDESEVTKSVQSAPETASVRGDKPPPPSKRTQAENLLKQARTAAKQKNCGTVKVMAKRAKQLDAAYYRDTFTRDPALKDCL